MKYCDVIVDISHEKLDKTFQYAIPENMEDDVYEGVLVIIPFGRANRKIKGYVTRICNEPKFAPEKTKEIIKVSKDARGIDEELILLAGWMKRNFGSTMNQALKTVIPIKTKSKGVINKIICLNISKDELKDEYVSFMARANHSLAKERFFEALMINKEIPWDALTKKLNIPSNVIRDFEKKNIITIRIENTYRNPVANLEKNDNSLFLNDEQQRAYNVFKKDYDNSIYNTYLVYGVTGSGKTLLYLDMIEHVISKGREVIVLIPEIALTYQTVMRFYDRFGDKVSILNSRMSLAERSDQFERAKSGDISIIVGPRSALFTPFKDLGLIVIDEEHESSYKSENVPKYHSVPTAIKRAEITNASVVLGSATPSIESFMKAKSGEYTLLELKKRATNAVLPDVEIVDMREELMSGNRSIISRRLRELIEDRISKKEQIILFLNRRGMVSSITCRECGHIIKCPHCDVALSLHRNNKMICHYCGYEEEKALSCPKCNSKLIGGFKIGTEKVEEIISKEFPSARVLRMDMDTTKGKSGHEQILAKFANNEADILVGTQMIVKGHDFPNVTLVGALMADMSLNVPDYNSSERTFELLTQAVGRAGRAEKKGYAIIQTYKPDEHAIVSAMKQDYDGFYQKEILYRDIMKYPPVSHMLLLSIQSEVENHAIGMSEDIAQEIKTHFKDAIVLGPREARIYKLKDVYRRTIYIKDSNYDKLVEIKDMLDDFLLKNTKNSRAYVFFDFDPINTF